MFRTRLFLMLSVVLISSFCYAEINDGVKWLYDNQNIDYSWGNPDTTGFRDTCVVTQTLLDLEGTKSNLLRAIDYIEATELDVCDYLARKIVALNSAGIGVGTLTDILVSYKNGYYKNFGYQKDDLGSPLDTGLVLMALLASNYSGIQVYVDIVNFLLYSQGNYDYWRFSPFETSGSIYCTSQVILSLVQVLDAGIFTHPNDIAVIKGAINKGTNWLKGQQNQDGGFGKDGSTIYETSIVALAFLGQPELRTSQNLKQALNYIRNHQQPNGSWNDKTYDTGIALKSLTQQRVIVNPTSGTIGTIVEIAGKGFGQTESISIDFGTTETITTSITNAKGTFTATFTIDIQLAGMTTIKATGLNSDLSADTYFKIISVPSAEIFIEPTSGTVGTILTITGDRFGQNEQVAIDFGITKTIATAQTNQNGTFTATFTVDLQAGCGTLTVRAKGLSSGSEAEAYFVMQAQITMVTPIHGTVGSIVTVAGNGYHAYEEIAIDFGINPSITLAMTDSLGQFKTTFTVDTQAGCGTVSVSGRGLISGCVAYGWFVIKGNIILVSPMFGTVGTSVTVFGNGFAGQEEIYIHFGTTISIALSSTDETGSFRQTFIVDTQPYGTKSIIVVGIKSGCHAQSLFFIQPEIKVDSPSEGTVGTLVCVIGNGYGTSEQIGIDFGRTISITTTTTDAVGRFVATFTVDIQAGCGTLTVRAKGLSSGSEAEAYFVMQAQITMVTPIYGTVGSIVTVAGNGYHAYEEIAIDFGINPSITLAMTDSLGQFKTTFTVDTQAGCGTVSVSGRGLISGCVAYGWFVIKGNIILVSPMFGTVGTSVTVFGNGFAGQEEIYIHFGTTISIALSSTDETGSFRQTFIVDTQPYGTKSIIVVGIKSGCQAQFLFFIHPEIKVDSPSEGTVGTLVCVIGNGYGTSEQIGIDFGTTISITTTTTDANGRFISYFVADIQPPGTTTVVVRGLQTGAYAIAFFFILEDTIPPVIGHTPITEAPAGLPMIIRATITDNVKVEQAILYWKIGGTKTISSTVMTNVGGDLYRGTIPASNVTMRGLLYAIWATDGKNDTLSTIWTTITYGTVSSGKIGAIYPTYKSISVPVHPVNPDPAGVLWNWGNFEQNVRLVYFDGSNWVIHNPPASTVPNFAPEIGYGITADKDNEIIVYGSSTNPSGYYVIPLKGGLPERWNHIGHPYLYPVALNAQVKFRKGIEVVDPVTAYVNGWIKSSLWYYDGMGFKMVSYPGVLRPWIGYFIPVTVDCEMLVPAEEIGRKHTPNPSQEGKSFCPIEEWVVENEVRSESEVDEFNPIKHKDSWAIQLSAKAGSLTDRFNFAGVSSEASDAYDDGYDIAEIPMLPAEEGEFAPVYLACYFISPTEDEYGSDYRSEVETSKEWKFRVEQVGEPGKVKISWDITTVPLQYYLYLKDRDNLIDMRKNKSYSGNKGEYSLIVSKEPIKVV
ncbi:MAG: prenyltransferase/squalene oxidase repeat-containing protein, partial [bacterium]